MSIDLTDVQLGMLLEDAANDVVVPDAAPRAAAVFARSLELLGDTRTGTGTDAERGMPRARRRPRRRMAIVVAATALAVGGGGVAAYTIFSRPAKAEAGALCRADASTTGPALLLPRYSKVLESCQRKWRDGELRRFGATERSPHLEICIDPAGTINVIPGDREVCDRLRLQRAEPTLSDTELLRILLQRRLVHDINLRCLDPRTATATVQRVLRSLGLSPWTVTSESVVQGRPGCLVAAIDAEHQIIRLVAIDQPVGETAP